MTTILLERLLLDSLMFSHDPEELEIWLSCLPSLGSISDPAQRVWLVAQQIHLLSFIDECARRCMKTPYRYMDDTVSLVVDYFRPNSHPHELISPLLMTIMEQLRAKILGQHIATEAAGIVLAYLRRVFLGLAGKMRDGQFINALLDRLEQMVKEARSKGQERVGLLGNVQEIQAEMSTIFGGSEASVTEQATAKLLEEE